MLTVRDLILNTTWKTDKLGGFEISVGKIHAKKIPTNMKLMLDLIEDAFLKEKHGRNDVWRKTFDEIVKIGSVAANKRLIGKLSGRRKETQAFYDKVAKGKGRSA